MRTLLAAVALTAGCGGAPPADLEPTVDASTLASVESSIRDIQALLSEREREQLSESLEFLVPATPGMFLQAAKGEEAPLLEAYRSSVDGKTAKEIIAEGKAGLTAETASRIAEVEEKLAGWEREEASRAETCEGLRILNLETRYYDDRRGIKVIARVRNDLDFHIRSIDVYAEIKSPGRPVPWLEGDAILSYSGGLAPGETREESLYPSWFTGDMDTQLTYEAEVAVRSITGPGKDDTVECALLDGEEREIRRLERQLAALRETLERFRD